MAKKPKLLRVREGYTFRDENLALDKAAMPAVRFVRSDHPGCEGQEHKLDPCDPAVLVGVDKEAVLGPVDPKAYAAWPQEPGKDAKDDGKKADDAK